VTRRRWDVERRVWVLVPGEGLGPCDTCGRTVPGGQECQDCLDHAGVRHASCCVLPFGGLR